MPLRVPPALSSSQCYRRAVVRACAEQLRVIEGRLDVGCGPRFEEQLSQDDLNGVARAILTLQRRTEPEAKLYLKLLEERETGAENGAARPAAERQAHPRAVLRKMKTTSGGALSMLGKALSSSGKSERGSGA